MVKKEIINGIEYEVWILNSVSELTPQKLSVFKGMNKYGLLKIRGETLDPFTDQWYSYEAYYKDGKLHNLYGPAIIMRSSENNISELYYINGIRLHHKVSKDYQESNEIKIKRRKL